MATTPRRLTDYANCAGCAGKITSGGIARVLAEIVPGPRHPDVLVGTETMDDAGVDRIAEGLALIDKAMRHAAPGPYQIQAAIAALHARAQQAADTDWRQIDLLYAALEQINPSPVVVSPRSAFIGSRAPLITPVS